MQTLLVIQKGERLVTTLHLLIGPPGRSKTSLGKNLETRCSALHLTPQEWEISLFDGGLEDHKTKLKSDNRTKALKSLVFDAASRALIHGEDVIIDLDNLGDSLRDKFNTFAKELSVEIKLHFIDIPDEIFLSNLETGNIVNPKETFLVSEISIKEWLKNLH